MHVLTFEEWYHADILKTKCNDVNLRQLAPLSCPTVRWPVM